MKLHSSEHELTSTPWQVLSKTCMQFPEKKMFALQSDNQSFLTGTSLLHKSRALGSKLQEMPPQTKAMLLLPQGLEYITALLACWYADIAAIPMAITDLSQPEQAFEKIKSILEDSQAACIITVSTFIEFLNAKLDINNIGILNLSQLELSNHDYLEPRKQKPQGLALLLYTSGSTSQPKGVMLTNTNVVSQALMGSKQWKINHESCIVSWMPQFHNFGLFFNILGPLSQGATSILLSPDSFLKNPELWFKTINQWSATHTAAPNFAFNFCCSDVDISEIKDISLQSLQAIICGGEPVRKETYEKFTDKFWHLGLRKEVFCPHYGLSEIGSVTTKRPGEALRLIPADVHSLELDIIKKAQNDNTGKWLVSCGEIKAPNQILIVNPETCEISSGEKIGEVWVKSPSVGMGYLNRDIETEQTFKGKLKHSKTKGFLRTGDLGYIEDNHLYIVGRSKEVMVIHGKNYYPADIEWTIKKNITNITLPLAAFSYEVNQMEQVMVVQEVPVSDDIHYQAVVDAIFTAVTETHQLELSKIVLVKPGSIPKTGSGKIQRRQCRNDYIHNKLRILYEYIRGGLEDQSTDKVQIINTYNAEMDSEVEDISSYITEFLTTTLKIEQDRINTAKSIQSVGLDSINIMRLIRGLEKKFQIRLTIREIFEHKTILSLAASVAQKRAVRNSNLEDINPAENSSRGQAYSINLSEGQKGLWMLQKMLPDMSAYNVPICFRISGELDKMNFNRACDLVVKKHPILNSIIIEESGMPLIKIHPSQTIAVQEEDISSIEYCDIIPYIREKSKKPFMMKNDPLTRIRLLSYQGKEHFVLITIHHIIFDGSSMLLLVTELLNTFKALLRGENPIIGTSSTDYADFVKWEKDMLESMEGEEHRLYWKNQLSGVLPILELPGDYGRSLVQSYAGEVYTHHLEKDLVNRVKLFAKDNNLNLSVVFLGIFKLLLYHYSGQDDIIVGMPVAGRPEERFEKIIGYFVNMIAVRSQILCEDTFIDFMNKLQFTLIDGLDHAAYPFPVLVRDLNIPRSLRNNPIFQVTFAYQNFFQSNGLNEIQERYRDVLPLEFVGEIHQEGEYELALEIYEQADDITLNLKYNPELFNSDTINRMMQHYLKLIEDGLKNPGLALKKYQLISHKEKDAMLADWNSNRVEYPDKCIHELFEEQAKKAPDALAVTCGEKMLTYGELSEKSDVIAARLLSEGITRECMVGLCMERSSELVAGILGILKAGGVYLPLEPRNPSERLKYMVKDSGASVILTQSKLINKVSQIIEDNTKVILIDSHTDNFRSENREENKKPVNEIKSSNLAYVIYTSGSTGMPKATMIEHKGIANLSRFFTDNLIITGNDRVAQFASISFDASTFEIFISLLAGASLCIIPQSKIDDVREFENYLNENKVTIALLPPPYLAGVDPERVTTMNKLITGGSEIDHKLLEKWYKKVKYFNAYGPTEDTIISTVWKCPYTEEALPESIVPIGKPINNKWACIVDRNSELQPIGITGELCIAGDGLARGYLNQPGKTAEKFIDNPFKPGTKLYKTGDLARYRADGNIEFLGRIDYQVKFHGFRIELGEIETQLRAHPEIQECAVVLKEQEEIKQLVGYYVRKNSTKEEQGSSINTEILRNHLKVRLPDYMIPAFLIEIETMPLTLSGKIDRKDLLNRKIEVVRTEKIALPQSQIEERILRIWKETLKIDEISTKDGFFQIGGDSILAVMAIDKINEELGLNLNVTILFKYSNIKALSEHVTTIKTERVLPLNTETDRKADLNRMNKKVDYSQPFAEYPEYYNESLAIIGISASFPGAKNHYEFWENIRAGNESIKILGREELIKAGLPDYIINNPDFIPVQASIEGKDLFDPEFFNISPKDTELMDPQSRLLLLHSWKAMEDAGYISRQILDTSVFMTASTNFAQSAATDEIMGDSNGYSSRIFAQGGTIATMISYKLGLKGPSLFVQTNCSSSLAGLNLAYQSLMVDDAKYALVGGCSIFTTSGYMHQGGMNFSSDGHVKTFDASADGIVGGDGVAVILVKKAADAIKDRDNIYALIRGVAVNNDGSDKVGFYAPGIKGQSEVIQKAINMTGVNPETISYIEAHGTGTKLGDPVELSALNDAYRNYTAKKQFCGIGSVKTNIGHLDTAAGLAGCIKVALSLYNEEIPQTLNYKNPNPNFDFGNSPFYVVDKLIKWDNVPFPRRAALSSFGIGGTNVHTIMEQYNNIEESKQSEYNDKNSYLIPISARNRECLKSYAGDMLAFMRKQQVDLDMASVAYTLQTGREEMNIRVIFVVSSINELCEKLEKFIKSEENINNCFEGDAKSGLTKFFEDTNSRELINNWLLTGDFLRIAELWAKGINIDWNLIYADTKPYRISLPTYPFSLKSYKKLDNNHGTNTAKVNAVVQNNISLTKDRIIKPNPALKVVFSGEALSDQIIFDYVKEVIMETLSASLKLDINVLDVDQSFADYGLDSISGISLVHMINDTLLINLDVTCTYEYSSVNQLCKHILSKYKKEITDILKQKTVFDDDLTCDEEQGDSLNNNSYKSYNNPAKNIPYANEPGDAIAIIGISGRFAKSETVNELWEHISKGDDLTEEVSRWDISNNYSKDDKYCKKGSFISDIDKFEPLFFNISGFEAAYMDPQQRIFLEECWNALEDSGYAGAGIQGKKCGVFVGCAAGDYQELLGEDLPAQAIWGNMSSVIPTRIAYYLDLHGPAIAVDTACSSSLVAMHLACQNLWSGESEMALAGGVYVQSTPKNFLAANKGGMLSPTGCCHSFDENADGFIIGEGAGVVVLKRLSDAIADGDHIYGIISGTAINQDGTTNGITAPSANAQERLERYVYDTFHINPEQIQMVEAHGTGTVLGDPIEFQALTRAFTPYSSKKAYCALGTIKTNIGHTQLVSGVAGVIKILLSLKNKKIPPALHFNSPNPSIQLEDSPFYVNTCLQDWEVECGSKRRAVVSSFGFSGTNAHMVIEEAPKIERSHSEKRGYLIVLSARSFEQLRRQAEQLVVFCDNNPQMDSGNMSYTLLLGRKHFNHRLACVVRNSDELATLLKKWLEKGKHQQVYVSELHGNDFREQPALKRYGNECIKFCAENDRDLNYMDNIATIADLYIQGYNLDFEQLFSNEGYCRIPLPTYPFTKERYWGADVRKSNGNANGEVYIHPLLHRNTSDFSGLRFSSTLTNKEFILRDHVVNGENILPGAAYLEMVRAAVANAIGMPELDMPVISLKNVVWARPVTVGNNPVNIHIGLLPTEAGEVSYKVYSESEEAGAEPIVYSEGLSMVNSRSDFQTLDLIDIQSKYQQISFSPEEFYGTIKKLGVSYGNSYRCVTEVYTGTDQILTRLTLPASLKDTVSQYTLHPCLLDAAFQSMSLVLSTSGNLEDLKPSLLFALQELEVVGAFTSDMWALIRYSEGSSAGDRTVKYDIDLYDEKGMLCVRMKKISTKTVGGASDDAKVIKSDVLAPDLTSQLVGNISLLPEWDVVEPEKSPDQLNPEQRVLIIGGSEHSLKSISQYYKSVSLLDIKPDDNIEDIAEKLNSYGCIEHIICIFSSDVIPSAMDNCIIDGQWQGVIQIFRLVKALLKLGYDSKDINWTLITSQTQPINKNDRINPTHASLHGFVGSMAKEYFNWKVKLIDIEAGCSWPFEDIFTMTPDSRGTALAYRGNQWYRQHLVQIKNLPQEQTLLKNEGVYVVIGGAGSIGEAWSECMIRRNNAKIVWIGRRAKDEVIQAKIDRLSEIGAEPLYISADAASIQSLQKAFDEIKQHHPVISGVVHSAQVFSGGSLSKIDEEVFIDVLSSKVNVCVNLARVFQKEPLDFMLFFSSINSYLTAPGQSPYSSCCVFEDAFAHQLAQELKCAVKVVNWGYFFNNVKDKARLEQAGIGLIEPEEAADVLDRLLSAPMLQMSFVKTTAHSGMRGMSISKELGTIYTQDAALDIRKLNGRILIPKLPAKQLKKIDVQMKEMDELLYKLLLAQLQTIGLFVGKNQSFNDLKTKIKPGSIFERWLEESIRLLIQERYVTYNEGLYNSKEYTAEDIETLWQEWELKKASWWEEPEMKAQVVLVEKTLRALPETLTGKKLATEAMFPGSSVEFVEAVYKNNIAGHFFNEILANTVSAYIEERLAQNHQSKLRIIEIGAGTGGTSSVVFGKLKKYGNNIDEYCYTDISKAFLLHAEEEYGPDNPYLTYKVFNVEQPIETQGICGGEYDIVIAANVLHATKNIRETMRNAKAVLKKNGLLLLNEISSNNLFSHLTFGLLEGWWMYEDPILRIPGCPGLAAETWHRLLEEEGFHSFLRPFENSLNFLQQIIAAQSDGIVRQKQVSSSQTEKGKVVSKVQADSKSQSEKATEAAMSKQEKRGSSKSNSIEEYIKRTMAQKISETLRVDMDRIGYGESLSDYGLDSIIAVNLVRIIGQALNIELDITIMFEYSTINQLAEYIISEFGELIGSSVNKDIQLNEIEDEVAATKVSEPGLNNTVNWTPKLKVFSQQEEVKKQEPLKEIQDSFAIIGISGRFPKGDSLSEYWNNLINGEDCIVEIPQERWSDWRHWYSDYKDEMEAMQSKWGGFISGVAEFDPLFFGISPKEAEYICPEQRLLLTYIWHAIEDAGITPKALPGIPTGVFIAAAPSDYRCGKMGINASDGSGLSANPSPSMMANRISYILNLSGPSECCETGCSSSLVALHRAIQSIKNHECEQAIIGAVNLLLSPMGFISLESANLLSKEGKSKSFQKDADGFVRSEGVGAIIIKPLSKAITDNDRIYAVIKGTSVAHGGKGVSLFAPNASGMKTAMTQAYRSAEIDPRTVSYIEAHGIGATLADSIEINALKSGYQELIASEKEDSQICASNCYISSLKPCIGHGEIFSGLAALIKVILAIQKRVIPGIPKFETINEDISLDRSPFLISSENHKWDMLTNSTGGQLPRRASINSYGLGGVNAHIVLEEYVPENEEPEQDLSENTPQIIVLSAKSKERLLAVSKQMLEFVESQEEYSLPDLAYTLQTGREAMGVRLAMVVRSQEDLVKALRQYLSQGTDTGLKGNTVQIYEGILEEQLNGLFSGKIGDIILQALLEENDPEKLAVYWVNGNDIPWEALYEGKKFHRISVPTYPFEKQLYWIGSEKGNGLELQKINELPEFNEYFDKAVSLSEYVVDIVSNLLKIEATKMKLNVPIEQYGIDSIMLMPLLQQLQTRIDPAINLTGLQKCRTIQDIIDMSASFRESAPVTNKVNAKRIMPTAWTGFPELVHLNQSSYGQPIFWIHGALGGVEAYKLIGQNLERPFFGIQARGWMTSHTPLHGIQAMASYYTHIIQTIQPEGPYDIGGFCLGGILAYEITRQLQELGQTVNTLVMIDSPDNTFQENLTGFSKNAVKNIIFQTVNMMLLSSVLQNPEKSGQTLIHRDELNIGVNDEDFFKQIIELAKAHGLTKTENQLDVLLNQNVKVQLAYELEKYKIMPIINQENIDCYYFRNSGGLFEGDLKPYLTVTSNELSFDHVNYWTEWKHQLSNLNIMDVDAPNHMMLLNEPKSVTPIIDFCSKLYSDKR